MKKFERRKKIRNKFFWGCVGLFLFSFLCCFFGCVLLTPNIHLEEKKIVLLYQEEVILPKYEAYFGNRDISDQVQVIGEVDSSKLGSYWIEYRLDSFLFPIKELVLVEVIEKDPPKISLVGGEEITLCPNSNYQELGYFAIDNYDGDITDSVEIREEEQEFYYRVEDSSGNVGEVVRKVYYKDEEVPVLNLKGKERIVLYENSTYVEFGYDVVDNCDSEIVNKVKVSGRVDTSRVGTYLLHYEVTDNSGNYISKTRTVEVISKPKKEDPGVKGFIYLTFDDGPSNSVTSKILDILKDEGVKATFFVIHHDSSLYSLIRREYQEGHTVALHSYTHNYGQIYRSSDAYFEDLNKIQKEVFSITGEESKIIRFPGGSSNTISKRYRKGIMSELTREVLSKGYRYFDWNVSSGDAGGVHSSKEVYQNVINGLSKSRSNVVLMHDFENNYYTLNALRDIIHYGKENGYVFEKITMDTSMVRHSVVN